jgi:hypothetical protein
MLENMASPERSQLMCYISSTLRILFVFLDFILWIVSSVSIKHFLKLQMSNSALVLLSLFSYFFLLFPFLFPSFRPQALGRFKF